MQQRTALITGANSGIGLATAIELRQRGWNVAITARDDNRGKQALARVLATDGTGHAQLLQLDLASFASVRDCAAAALEQLPTIDALVNNAGVNRSERSITEDGIETTLQVNHFGHFLLTSQLLERLLQSDDARVINVTSMLHQRADGLDLEDLQLQRRWGRMYPYAASKLANILFTRELHRHYHDDGLTTVAIHPGGVRSRLGADGDMRGLARLIWTLLTPLLLSPERGAAPVVEAADSPGMRDHSGAYFNRHTLASPSPAAQDDAAAAALWDASTDVTKATFPEPSEASA